MRQGAVDVWVVDLARASPLERRLEAVLDDEEHVRADGFVRPEDARRHRVAHGALRTILGRSIGILPQHIRFAYGEHGKPFLAGDGPHFSLSHSGALALVAVSAGTDVGVDVEEVRAVPEARALARRFFSPDQARLIAAQPPGGRDVRFLRSWTAMEASLKAEGIGLADGLDGCAVRAVGDDRAQVTIAGAPLTGRAWSVCWLAPAPRHLGAVAVAARGGEFTVRVRRFA